MNKNLRGQAESLVSDSYHVSIFIAGDLRIIKSRCRHYCMEHALCVTIAPCDFIYDGGHEDGAEISLRNFPKHPRVPEHHRNHATELAHALLIDCTQYTCMIVEPEQTIWLSRKEPE